MFKKTILAAGLIAASSMGYAASWQNTDVVAPINVDEGIVGIAAGTGVPVASAVIRLGAEYQVNDTITFTFNQAKAANSAFPSSLYSNKHSAVAAAKGKVKAAQDAGDTAIVVTQTAKADFETPLLVGDTMAFGGHATLYYVKAIGSTSDTEMTMTVNPALTAAVAKDETITATDSSSFTLNLLSATSTSATYRVAATPTGGATTIGTLIQTPAIEVTPAGLIAADATVSFAAATAGGTAMDTLATAATVGKSVSAFKQTITKFDGVIDVEQGRLGFKGGSATAGGDTLTIATATTTKTTGNSVTFDSSNVADASNAVAATDVSVTKTVHTIDGDVSWMDTAAATAGIQTGGVTVAGGATAGVINAAGSSITITDADAVAASTTLTIAKEAKTAAVSIPETSFSGKTIYTYASGGAKTLTVTHADLGKFALNGAAVTAYGVPMGSTVSRFLWVNNKGAIPAVMSATVVADGTSYGPYEVGTAAAKSSMSMATAIDAALTGAGVTLPDASRANIMFSSAVKAADVTISAAYKHIADADRLTIETSDTVVGAMNCTGTLTDADTDSGTSASTCSNAK